MTRLLDNKRNAVRLDDINDVIVSFNENSNWVDWATHVSSNIEGNIYIATYSLPSLGDIKDALRKKPYGISIIANRKFFEQAYYIKEAFPNVQISLRANIHAKFVIAEPNFVWLSSANFGKSGWLEHAISVESHEAFEFYKHAFDEIFNSSKPVETLKPCPFCGEKLKLIDKDNLNNSALKYVQGDVQIHCKNCHLVMTVGKHSWGDHPKEEAVDVWNRRANSHD